MMVVAQMQRLLPASLALLVLAGQAMAADLPVYKAPPPPLPTWSWAGFYAGINAGYSFGADPYDQALNNGTVTFAPTLVAPRGAVLGGQLGYNWQINQFVFGLEGDGQWTGQRDTGCGGIECLVQSNGEVGAFQVQHRLDWFATARGRVGWANDSYLLYATGGAAWGSVRETDRATLDTLTDAASSSQTRNGWAAGAGLEARLWGNWSAKVEYLHLDLGSMTTVSHLSANVGGRGLSFDTMVTTNSRIRDEIVRVGLNYQIWGAPNTAVSPAPVYGKAPSANASWTGVYLGLDGGYGVGNNAFTQNLATPGSPITSVMSWDRQEIAPRGGFFGGQIGYNQQFGSFVLGVEGDAQWADLRDSVCGTVCQIAGAQFGGGALFQTVSQHLTWFATARGRAGWAHDRYLFYVTGGAAWAGLEETDAIGAPTVAATFSQTKTGWVAGGGIEARLWDNWSAKLEYLRMDLGSTSNTIILPGATLTTLSSIREDIVRAGLNYKFGFGPVVARY
jgi:outer membrane immunogenic protein